MKQVILDLLVNDFGYEVSKWKDSKDGVSYSPEVCFIGTQKVDTSVNIKIYQDKKLIIIKDYKRVKKHIGVYDLKGKLRVVDSEVSEILDGIKVKEKKAALTEFLKGLEEYKGLPTTEGHSIFKDKKLKQLSGKTVLFKGKPRLLIPFENIDEELVGVQLRMHDNKKLAVKGSSFLESWHIVQEGIKDPRLFQKICFLSESLTTATEIAECRPKDMVVCCAGQGVFNSVYNILAEQDLFMIAVLDKNRHVNVNSPTHQQTERLIKRFIDDKLPYLLPDVADSRIANATDFNDMAMILGKEFTHTRINQQISLLTPTPPVIIGNTGRQFVVVSSLDNKAHVVDYGNLVKESPALASPAYWKMVCPHIKEGEPLKREDIQTRFLLDGAINKTTEFFGAGIYKEEDTLVVNGNGTRFTYKDNIITACASPVAVKNMYSNLPAPALSDFNPALAAYDIKKLEKLLSDFVTMYNLPESQLLAMLGFIVQASYASIIDKRCHLWVHSASGSGKSLLCKALYAYLIPHLSFGTEDATSSWLTSQLSDNRVTQASPLIFIDEFGDETAQKRGFQKDMITMMRGATDNDFMRSGRSSASLASKTLKKRFSAVVCSTYFTLDNTQDQSRFCTLEMTSKIKGKKLSSYGAFTETCAEAAETFMFTLLKGEKDFFAYREIVYEKLQTENDGILSSVGHKDVSMSAVLAGACIVYRELKPNISLEQCAEETYAKLQGFIKENCDVFATHLNKNFENVESVLDVQINEKFGYTPMYQVLCNPESKEYYKNHYGIIIKKEEKTDNLYMALKRDTSALSKLITSEKHVKHVFHGIKDNIIDAVQTDPTNNYKFNTRALHDKKVVAAYRINLSEDWINKITKYLEEKELRL